jgi:hypothetical protein
MTIERLLSCFDKKSERLQWEENIDEIDLDTLKTILKPDKDEYLELIYKIDESNCSIFEKSLKVEFDFEKYIYEIGCFKIM